MEIKRNSWIVKLAFPFGIYNYQTDLCTVFWRCVATLTLVLMGIGYLILLGMAAVAAPLAFATTFVGCCALVSIPYMMLVSIPYMIKRFKGSSKPSIVKAFYRDFKDKHCTLITLVD